MQAQRHPAGLRRAAVAVVYSVRNLPAKTETRPVARQVISTPDAPEAIGPYSQAISSSGLLFCSGQLGLDPVTMELAEGLQAQVSRALDNLVAVLRAAGAGTSEVIKTTVYLADMADFPAMNEIYAGYFTESPPARSTVAVKALPKNALFEIEAIAQIEG
jgi:2-iminobutanoate/2-iminopropanoate deaminase